MKTMRKIIGLMLCIMMVVSAVGVQAALPGLEQNIKAVNFKVSNGSWGAGGSASTFNDDTMGTVYRWTTDGSANNFSVNMQWYFDETERNNMPFKAGDKLYMSYYYRVNDTTTDASSVATPEWVAMAQKFWGVWEKTTNIYSSSTEGINTTGEWMRYEGIVEFGWDRTWYESAMWLRGQTTAAEKISIDFAGAKCIYLGAATDETDVTILQQVQANFSSDSTATISLNDQVLDFSNGSVDQVSTLEAIQQNLTVAPTAAAATYKVMADETAQTVTVRVFSELADIVNPAAGTYTDYVIRAVEPIVEIAANDGKGVKGTFVDFHKLEGLDPEKEVVDDPTFGKVYRYRAEYTEQNKWPKLNMAFELPEVATVATDYVYFSFYLRANTTATDPEVGSSVSYICRSTEENGIGNGIKTTDIFKPGVIGALDQWSKIEYIVPVNAAKTASVLGAKLQFGAAATDYGKKVSFDVAAPVCYYLGQVTSNVELDENAVIAKLNSTFTGDKALTALSVYDTALDVSQTQWEIPGSPAKTLKGLSYTAPANAYVAVFPTADSVKLRVFAQNTENMLNPKADEYQDYVIDNKVLIDEYAIKYNNTAITDFSQAFAAGDYEASFKVTNTSTGGLTGKAIFAAYSNGGKILVGASVADVNVAQGTVTPAEIKLPVTLTEEAENFKIFLLNDMTPILSTTGIDHQGIQQ